MAVKKAGKFGGRTHAQKNFSCCSLYLRTVTITATVRDSHQYSNDSLQGRLEDCLLHFYIYGRSLAEAGTVIKKFNFDARKLLVYHFSLNTAATPFSN